MNPENRAMVRRELAKACLHHAHNNDPARNHLVQVTAHEDGTFIVRTRPAPDWMDERIIHEQNATYTS